MQTMNFKQPGRPRTGFPTLDGDLTEDGAAQPARPRRVCIATSDLLGPLKNGGIGTAYHHVARFLAEQGHEVVIAYVNYNVEDAELMADSEVFYREFGVAFAPIVPDPDPGAVRAQAPAPGWALLEWLRMQERPFDIVHVSESRGLGYGALLAKTLGLGFGSTHFVVKGSSPTLWQSEGNRQLISTELELGWVFMERRCVELADTVICGSAHLLEWMREAGYALPARSFVWPNVFPAPDPSPEAAAGRASRDGVRLEEVVFFGRLEPRKGLILFIDAIDRLARRGRAPERVTFLGGVSPRIHGPGLIREASERWPAQVRAITDHGSAEAVAYLSQPGRLAVIPSLLENSSIAVMECLHAGIPFVAAATGGTPELIAPEDRERALVAPDHIALGERIAELAAAPLRAVRPRWEFERSLQVWRRWHGQEVRFEASAERYAQRARHAQAETPLVTVCIVHHERPELVRMAVDSVYAQDYPALEAVLVDDGSEGAEALAALAVIEGEFAERGWAVVRQENRYLGAARNAAAARARGEWLLFLDDDNLLFPDAVSRLVRAARFSGADCVPAASIRFFGEGDPRTDPDSHGAPIRYLGAARVLNRFRNVVGDACALVRREVFEGLGGFTEEYRVGLDDLSFFNHVVQAGHRIEPMPDPVYWYRIGRTSMKSRNRSAEAGQVRVIAPQLAGRPAEERASVIYSVAQRNAARRDELHYRAELAMSRCNWDLACELWGEVRRLFPDHPPGFIRGAGALLEAGCLEDCSSVASEALERFPDRIDAYYHLAELAMRRRDWDLAIELWGEMRRLFPDEASGFIRGTAALLETDRLEECDSVASEAAERFPERSEVHFHRAELAMRRRDWDLAIELWGEMRRLFPGEASGFIRGTAALLETDRLEECDSVASEAAECFPERSEVHFHRAELAMRRRDWDLAIELWGEVRRRFPDYAPGFIRGTAALLETDRLEECDSVASEAAERFPERSEVHFHRAELAMRRRDWDLAIELWGEVRRRFPDEASGFIRGTAALLETDRLEECDSVASEAAERFPERSEVHFHRAELAMRRRDWDLACELWGEVRRRFPDYAPGFIRGTAALLETDRLEECSSVASEAAERFPERSEAHYHRAELAMRRRDWDLACELWGEVRRRFPDYAPGFIRGSEALLESGRLKKCELVANEAVERFPDRTEGHHYLEVARRRGDGNSEHVRRSGVPRTIAGNDSSLLRGAAFSRAGRWPGFDALEVGVLLDPAWFERAEQRGASEPSLELRRNGRAVARASAQDVSHDAVQLKAGSGIRLTGDVLYSVHDGMDGELLAALAAPAWWRARRVAGAVESRDQRQIRGWLFDPAEPERFRRIAIHVDGRLRAVLVAGERRDDIARWKGTDGYHGFVWPIPETATVTEETRIEVFDADTGRALFGSPLRVEGGRVVASRQR